MIKNLLRPTKTKRFLFFLISDIAIFTLSLYISFLLRFDFNIPSRYVEIIPFWIPVFVFGKISLFYLFKVYKVNWRFIGLKELFIISNALLIFFLSLMIVDYLLQIYISSISIPRSVIVIDFFVSLSLVSLIRIAKRIYLEVLKNEKGIKRTLIIGAGETGNRILKSLQKSSEYMLVAFVDDDNNKIGTYIHGIPVLGKVKQLPEIIKENIIETVIIAIPSLTHKEIKKIYDYVKSLNVKEIKIVPSISNLPEKINTIKDLKDLSIEDLLSREPIEIDFSQVKEFLKGKDILVTGAGGSIGSEIVRQLIEFSPKKIVAFEIDETELHSLTLELQGNLKNIEFIPVVGDIRDKEKLKKVFEQYNPNIVFHAAAYKHVPLMEFFPEEAVKTNIIGTYNLAKLSIDYNVEKFINISTDKAVNPTSIMGATKRMAEMICSSLNELVKTKFISVRFGNVLGSRGSVIPIFLEQIKKGGPVTVTHPEMKRYFMTIKEAVLLVFQAAAMGKGGEVFVLDMGEPVKIVKLAEDLIKLQGLEPYKDIDIVFTGLRPGEKLFEELLTAEEGTEKTYHKKIFIAIISKSFSKKDLDYVLKFIEDNLSSVSNGDIKNFLRKYIPFYNDKVQ